MKTNRASGAIIYLSIGTALLGALATGAYLFGNRATAPGNENSHAASQTVLLTREDKRRSGSQAMQIELAMAAYKAGNLVTPSGANALEYYLAARQSKFDDVGAQEAILELLPVAMAALESAIASNTATEVERLIDLLERADPSAARVAALKLRWQSTLALQSSAPVSTLKNAEPAPPILTRTEPAPTAIAPSVTTISANSATTPKPLAARAANGAVRAANVGVRAENVGKPALSNASVLSAGSQVANAPEPNRIVEARPLSTARAVFPAQARRQKIEGWVDIQVEVDARGRVTAAQVVDAQPSRIFDVEARRAAMRWRYSPKLVNDQPVSSVQRQRIKFSLSG